MNQKQSCKPFVNLMFIGSFLKLLAESIFFPFLKICSPLKKRLSHNNDDNNDDDILTNVTHNILPLPFVLFNHNESLHPHPL